MKRTIQDVDGDELTITTDEEEVRRWRRERGPPVVVLVDGPWLFDVRSLDELIAALQEARDEIVGRDAPPSSPAGHADV